MLKAHGGFITGSMILQVPIKGMNHVDTLKERQDITKSLIADGKLKIYFVTFDYK